MKCECCWMWMLIVSCWCLMCCGFSSMLMGVMCVVVNVCGLLCWCRLCGRLIIIVCWMCCV